MEKLFTEVDVVIVRNPSDMYYLTEYKNADAVMLLTPEQNYYFTDSRYFEEVSSLRGCKIENIAGFYDFLKRTKGKRVGIDYALTVEEKEKLEKVGKTEIIFVGDFFIRKRAVKTEKELSYIQQAQAITDKSFTDILGKIREGMTERELDRLLKSTLYLNGADGLSFDPIVAFGENTSKPHAHPTEKKLEKGMFVTLDFGASLSNYCSDMTRTFAFGKPTEEMKEIYDTVLHAQETAMETMRADWTGKACDKVARDVFAKKNLAEYFTHSLGHGIGIDIHEKPLLSRTYEEEIPCGAVTSVEPGLYFPKKFGVRIENMILFTKNGVNNLTNSEKKLIII